MLDFEKKFSSISLIVLAVLMIKFIDQKKLLRLRLFDCLFSDFEVILMWNGVSPLEDGLEEQND